MLSVSKRNHILSRNGISILMEMWGGHKKPVLAVNVEEENCVYKVASFNSVETANWFIEKFTGQFLDGLLEREND